jgi:hypothetical protein
MTTNALEIRLPTDQFRSLPIPGQSIGDKPTKLYNCFVKVEDLPSELADWMQVNPRMPQRRGEAKKVTGKVAQRIMNTLRDDPALFVLKNQGIYILVDHAEHVKEAGGEGFLVMRLTDKSKHGVVNGGHTLHASLQVVEDGEIGEAATPYVRLHILESVDPDRIVDLAEGLNRSLQVKDASLANLEGAFETIKAAMTGKQGADRISYTMGDGGEIDIQDVLARMAALNLKLYPDETKSPNTVFGQPTKVLADFQADIDPEENGGFSAYELMMPQAHEILSLFDRVASETQHYQSKEPRLALLGRKRGKDLLAKKPKDAPFAEDVIIERRYFAGLIYPIFAAFRANIDQAAWQKGVFKWIMPPEELLAETINDLCDVVRAAYTDLNNDPAQVGKKPSAYRSCYQVVLLRLLRAGKLAA